MNERFTPRFHYCEDGNHYHLLTGLNYGASSPFISVEAGRSIISGATNLNDQRDLADAARLMEELNSLKLRHTKHRWGPLYAQLRWLDHLTPYWSDFVTGRLAANEELMFGIFACDFVSSCMRDMGDNGRQLVLRLKKVSEVEKNVPT